MRRMAMRAAACTLALSTAHAFVPAVANPAARRGAPPAAGPADAARKVGAARVGQQRRARGAEGGAGRGGHRLQMLVGEGANVVENMLKYPQTWTFVLLGGILALGWGFERAVEAVEERIDKRLMPVVQQSVLELATLGFIGLVIQTLAIGHKNSWLSALSETFLGDHDLLFEQFEQVFVRSMAETGQ